MQSNHKELGDISFNFMIGCDGKVYEGRGFNLVGAHTKGYNETSLGIAFIGQFCEQLPPSTSMQICKALLKMGVEDGHIAPDYKLVGQREVMPTLGPGQMLYDKLQTLRE